MDSKILDQELSKLYKAAEASWASDTTWNDEFDVNNPSQGQCGVTSLYLKEYLVEYFVEFKDSQIVEYLASFDGKKITHYFLSLSDGTEIDFTRQQFPPYTYFTYVKVAYDEDLFKNEFFVSRYLNFRSSMWYNLSKL